MVGDYLGNLFIVAAPSGGGKTSLVRRLVETLDSIEVSISHTTRPMRPGEQHGKDYFFVDEKEFICMVNECAFLEYARVFNHLYGTSMEQITKRLNEGIDVVLDIDWQGAQQIRHSFPDAVGIFIVPPSLEELKQRLLNRRQDKDEVISDRMKKAQDELSHYSEFNYLIVNDNFERAAMELGAIVLANRLRIERQINKQAKLLSFLMSSQ
ncbi:guanylate kinase [Legionella longbeachae]|uniref:guanylate kinase n=1 Tax=Legionella longbeachae TaxID=450 RepID=UPI000A2F241E|nr:guanylate kinase [Legionella longbeachae]ARB91905.2 guanylate kinase [Legionella longbeachae]ARM34911.2 guanylate kinase [Legionella longbeachae]QEY53189.1 guanylate kinase [Legionella longbeachae]QIN34021.1 guanylate kinase [Legionella longbeachae]QIN37352.1 guanylate kinase [Legionella longbeachae]